MWRASRASLLAASVLAMGACGDGGGGNTGPSGVPTRIVFQYAGSGGVFDDNVPVTPGTALLVRATPVDADGHVFANLTENWSVAGGGALDAAVTTPAGGNDPTLNRWSIGPTTGVQLITVTLPAYPAVTGTVHVRAVNLQIVRVAPDTAADLTLALGQTVPLTVQLRTAEGQPFIWPIAFSAGIAPFNPCGESHPTADVGSFTPGGTLAWSSDTLSPDSQGMVTVMYTAPTRLSVQDEPPGSGCMFFVRAEAVASPGGLAINAAVSPWMLHQSAGPPSHIVAVSGDGQAASPGATLALPLQVQVTDAYGNALTGIAVTWVVLTGGGSVNAGTTTTTGAGQTSVVWTVGAMSGPQTVSASITGGISVVFTATVS